MEPHETAGLFISSVNVTHWYSDDASVVENWPSGVWFWVRWLFVNCCWSATLNRIFFFLSFRNRRTFYFYHFQLAESLRAKPSLMSKTSQWVVFCYFKSKENSTFISHNHFLSLYNLNDNAHKQKYIFSFDRFSTQTNSEGAKSILPPKFLYEKKKSPLPQNSKCEWQ